MHLEKLELKGFKSFKDKVTLEFPDKFTGIVGPNGSGKSNITEAVCFVLGKSRGPHQDCGP
ncbi:MAG: AAA family ATPase [Candidatus Altiarchaeota archaeon]|nr:AAA family ATPase [Candidatus Altiarchaeota archaeon]